MSNPYYMVVTGLHIAMGPPGVVLDEAVRFMFRRVANSSAAVVHTDQDCARDLVYLTTEFDSRKWTGRP